MAGPEVRIVQEGYIKTVTDIEVTADNRSLDVYPDQQLEGLELHQGFPVEIKINV